MQDNIGAAQDRYEIRRELEAENRVLDEDEIEYEDWSDEDENYECEED